MRREGGRNTREREGVRREMIVGLERRQGEKS